MKLLKKRSVSIKTLGKSFRRSKSKIALRKSTRQSSKNVMSPVQIEEPPVDVVEAEPAKEDVQEEKAMSVSSKPPSPMSVSSEHNDEEETVQDNANAEEEVAAPTEAALEEPVEEPTEETIEENTEETTEVPTEETSEVPTEETSEVPTEETSEVPTEEISAEDIAEPTETAPEEEAASSTEEAKAEIEEEAAKSTETEEEDVQEMEEDNVAEEDVSLEPSIEMIQKEEVVAIGFYTPEVEEKYEEEVEEDFMSRTLAIGAEIMDQYFSCLPACQENSNQVSAELATSDVKQVVAPVVQEQPGSTPEVDDRNDSLGEENPAADLHGESRQEIRV